jgi:hypothetical protein
MRQIEPTVILPPYRFRLTDYMVGHHGRRKEGKGVRAKYRNCLGLHATYWRGLRLCKYLERNVTNLGILHEKLSALREDMPHPSYIGLRKAKTMLSRLTTVSGFLMDEVAKSIRWKILTLPRRSLN